MKKRLAPKKVKEGVTNPKKSKQVNKKKYEEERAQLKEISQRSATFASCMAETVTVAKNFSMSLNDWSSKTEAPLSNALSLVAGFQTALGDLQLKVAQTLEDKVLNPVKDMLSLERDLLAASKKDDLSRSEAMKVETFRMSLVEKLCEYLEEYRDYFKRGSTLLNNYSDEVSKSKNQSRKQVEEILTSTLEEDVELNPPPPPPPIFGAPLEDTIKRDLTPIPRIIQHIIAYLDQNALEQMGIFRISGHSGSVQALKEEIDSGREVDLSLQNNVHVVCTLFKLYLRTLPDTLTIQDRFDQWLEPMNGFSSPPSEDGIPSFPQELLETYTSLVDSLPTHNAYTLDFLISFCTRVVAKSDQNMMGAKNLASLIGPNIMSRAPSAVPSNTTAIISSTSSMLEDVTVSNRVVECLILNYNEIFKNVKYALKDNPVQSLELLSCEFPLCADRSVIHGSQSSSNLVDTELQPPEIVPAVEGKGEALRKRHQKEKKTVSSLSLFKDKERKSKKKEKQNSSSGSPYRSTVMPESSSELSDSVPKREHPIAQSAPKLSSPESSPSDPSSDKDGLLSTSTSNSQEIPILVTTPRGNVTAAAEPVKATKRRRSSTSRSRKSSEIKSNTASDTSKEKSETSGAKNRRHSITLASGEGLDPTQANFGTIGHSSIPPEMSEDGKLLNLDALIDEPSASIRFSQRMGRPSVIGRGSISGRTASIPMKSPPVVARSKSEDVPKASDTLTVNLPTKETVNSGDSASPIPPSSPREDSQLKKKISKDRTSALKTLKFENPDAFNTLMDERFCRGAVGSYVVIGYSGPSTLTMQAGGEGSVDTLVSQLDDKQVQYALIRLSIMEDGNPLTRDVFVQWNGPQVSPIQKGIKKAHAGEVKQFLAAQSIELLVSSRSNFTLDAVLDKSNPISSSHIID